MLARKNKEHNEKLSSYWKLPELAQDKAIAQMEKLEKVIKEHEQKRGELQKELDAVTHTIEGMNWLAERLSLEDGEFFRAVMKALNTVHQEGQLPALTKKYPDLDYARLIAGDEKPLTLEEKLEYARQFNLQGRIFTEDGQLKIQLKCTFDGCVLPVSNNDHFPNLYNRRQLDICAIRGR